MKIWLYILWGILVLVAAFFLIPGFFGLFVNPKKEYTKDSKLYRLILNLVSGIALWFMRVKIHVDGADKLPSEKRLLFVGNHRSNFDPIITWFIFRKWNIAYVSKASNFKIPILGRLIHRCCFMSIDRENARKAIGTINHAAELLQKQEVSIGIYPEGTRAKDGVMLPFHNGVFRIAQKADADIAVLTISGTETIHKNYPFRRSHVYLNVAEVIPSEVAKKMKTADIGERVRQTIEENLSKQAEVK